MLARVALFPFLGRQYALMTTGMTRSFHDKTLQWAPAGERVSNVCVLEGCTRRVGSRSKNKYLFQESNLHNGTRICHIRVEKTASRPSVGKVVGRYFRFSITMIASLPSFSRNIVYFLRICNLIISSYVHLGGSQHIPFSFSFSLIGLFNSLLSHIMYIRTQA